MAKEIVSKKVFVCPECGEIITHLKFNTTLTYDLEDGFVDRSMDAIVAGAWNFTCPLCRHAVEVDYDNMNVKGE